MVMEVMRACLSPDTLVWGNGADFDLVILENYFRRMGWDQMPWSYKNVRCYRTLKNLVPDIPFKNTGVAHSAEDDAAYQALHAIQLIVRVTRGGWL